MTTVLGKKKVPLGGLSEKFKRMVDRMTQVTCAKKMANICKNDHHIKEPVPIIQFWVKLLNENEL